MTGITVTEDELQDGRIRLANLEPTSRRMAPVVLYAVIAWRHQGSRRLPSHLLLPSESQFNLLGRFIGVVPIEVGRGAGEHPGAPRLMRSSYWQPDPFEKHGRIVAALEDRHRRTDRQISIVVHQWTGGEAPSPPASILPLLAHCVLGSHDTAAACKRLAGSVECPNIQRRFQNQFDAAKRCLAESERYLDMLFFRNIRTPESRSTCDPSGQTIISQMRCGAPAQRAAGILLPGDTAHRRTPDASPLPQTPRHGKEQVPALRITPELPSRGGFAGQSEHFHAKAGMELVWFKR